MKKVLCLIMLVILAVSIVGVASADVISINTEDASVVEIAEAIEKLKELLILKNGGYEPGLTLENFNKIETGMTYEMVVALFGAPGEVQMELDMGSPEYRTVNYQWGSGFEYCAITFQGDKVAMKMQIGLK